MKVAAKLTRPDAEVESRARSLRTAADVAELLELPLSRLNFILYGGRYRYPYFHFEIPKRGGGSRPIASPPKSIAILQRKLVHALSLVYRPRACVHGFVPGRSIATNALLHVGKRFVLNIDLLDFFTEINFGRVRGMFMSPPYKLGPPAATVLAQLACDGGHLPQGAPTSPIISNMVCGRLDSELVRLARRFRCRYSRYADDITLSTNRRRFPLGLAQRFDVTDASAGAEEDEKTVTMLGPSLIEIIASNGFQVNPAKARLQHAGTRQEVTGVIVNRHPNTYRRHSRQVRAMIHAVDKHGAKRAASEFAEKYDPKQRAPSVQLFRSVLLGKLEFIRMVKGDSDRAYRNLVNRLHHVEPSWIDEITPGVQAEIDRDWRFWQQEWQPRVFQLEVTNHHGDVAGGSGVRIDRTRLLTAAHVVSGMASVMVVLPDGTSLNPKRVELHGDVDAGVDAAILTLDFPRELRTPPPPRQLELPTRGSQIAALGFPAVALRRPDLTMTPGYVESTPSLFDGSLQTIQVGMQLGGGNSGGPVIDRGGNLVGIVMELTVREDTTVAPRSYHQVLPLRAIGPLLDLPAG